MLLLALFGGDMPPEFGGNVIRKFSKADLVCDSGDFTRRVDARARHAFEVAGGTGWDAAGDAQLPWIIEARDAELAENPEGSIEAQKGEIVGVEGTIDADPDGRRVTE